MAYNGFVTKLTNLRKHSNADRLMCAEVFGNTVIVGLDYDMDTSYLYFPTDGQLSVEYCEVNNLVRKKDDAGNNIGGYLDPDKRNITALKLRGEKSDGLIMPLDSLATFGDISNLKVGDTISTFNGVLICDKYVPRRNRSSNGVGTPKTKKSKLPIAPLFLEHKDTEQLAYNLPAFKGGDVIEITLKMHGTSQRTGYLPTLQKYKRSLWDILFKRSGTPVYDWGYVSGTRRVVLENFEGGFYGSNTFREEHSKHFEGKLMKGETVYYEVVGYTTEGGTIMGTCSNKKAGLGKDFVKDYGEETIFSYGCNVGESKTYVYRMTMTNEDGFTVEYTPEFMRVRCEQMGVEYVPVFVKFIIPERDCDRGHRTPGEYVQYLAECYYDGTDPIGKTHVKEGVVARIVSAPTFKAYKHKNFSFKVLEGIIKTEADAPDMEEGDGENEETTE